MKIFQLIILVFIVCCHSKTDSKSDSEGSNIDNKEVKSNAVTDTLLIVKATQNFSPEFLQRLKKSGQAKKYLLDDDFMIMDDKDTVWFSLILELGTPFTLTGQRGNDNYTLIVTQINYSTIKFKFLIINSGKIIFEKAGEASLSPNFFLGAETDEDDKTGDGYIATEYWKIDDDCEFSIRLGTDDVIKAKVKSHCKQKSMEIKLDDCPTLRSKEE